MAIPTIEEMFREFHKDDDDPALRRAFFAGFCGAMEVYVEKLPRVSREECIEGLAKLRAEALQFALSVVMDHVASELKKT